MKTVNIYEAKTRLSQLVDKAASGEDVVVSRNGKPVARITRLEPPKKRVVFGVLKGKVKASGFVQLPVTAAHAAGVADLPLHHADPFDRLLIARALAEPLRLLTSDDVLPRYGEWVILV